MNPPRCQVRRATLEDLDELRQLWRHATPPATGLERRLTEFQVAAAADGKLLGCLGLQIAGPEGKIHSEAYGSPELKSELRSLLWERALSVARNHGLLRLWIQAPEAFWGSCGFQEVSPEDLRKLPEAFGDPAHRWSNLKLREEISKAVSAEQEFELFKEAQREWSERALRQARTLRIFAGIIATGTLFLAIWAVWYVLRRLPPPGLR